MSESEFRAAKYLGKSVEDVTPFESFYFGTFRPFLAANLSGLARELEGNPASREQLMESMKFVLTSIRRGAPEVLPQEEYDKILEAFDKEPDLVEGIRQDYEHIAANLPQY